MDYLKGNPSINRGLSGRAHAHTHTHTHTHTYKYVCMYGEKKRKKRNVEEFESWMEMILTFLGFS